MRHVNSASNKGAYWPALHVPQTYAARSCFPMPITLGSQLAVRGFRTLHLPKYYTPISKLCRGLCATSYHVVGMPAARSDVRQSLDLIYVNCHGFENYGTRCSYIYDYSENQRLFTGTSSPSAVFRCRWSSGVGAAPRIGQGAYDCYRGVLRATGSSPRACGLFETCGIDLQRSLPCPCIAKA